MPAMRAVWAAVVDVADRQRWAAGDPAVRYRRILEDGRPYVQRSPCVCYAGVHIREADGSRHGATRSVMLKIACQRDPHAAGVRMKRRMSK